MPLDPSAESRLPTISGNPQAATNFIRMVYNSFKQF